MRRLLVVVLLVVAAATARAQDDPLDVLPPLPGEDEPPENATAPAPDDDPGNATAPAPDDDPGNATAPPGDDARPEDEPASANATADPSPEASPPPQEAAADPPPAEEEPPQESAPVDAPEPPSGPRVEPAAEPRAASTAEDLSLPATDEDPLVLAAVGPSVAPEDQALPVGLLLVGGMAAAVALAARTPTRRWWPALVGLFTRIPRDRLLAHPVRRDIHARIGTTPGIRYRELAAALGLAHGVLTHHLRMLERAQMVVARREGGVARFYHAGAAPRGPVLDAATEALLALVRDAGRVRVAEAAARLAWDRREVIRRGSKLVDLGVVARVAEGRAVYLVAVS